MDAIVAEYRATVEDLIAQLLDGLISSEELQNGIIVAAMVFKEKVDALDAL